MRRPLPRYSALGLLRPRFSRKRYLKSLLGARELKKSYDVVIVGAGGHGLATAFHLARDHRVGPIAVLEKHILGYGNLTRNTTIVRSNYLLPENQYFYEYSLRRW